MTTFKDLGLSGPLLDALEKVGYTDPTPIQEQTIPELLNGSDVIGQAQTGTGKTAAFGLPMLQGIDPELREVQGLVLTPTRELCIQVAQSLRAYGAVRGIDVLATFGGAPIRQQMDRLKAGPQVVVGTVGRVLDLNGRHSLMFHDARFVVLDEADEMLDLGFLEDVETILKKCPNGRQTALFSATMPPAIAKLAERHLHDPMTIKVKAPTLTIDTVEHFQVQSSRGDKVDALVELLKAERPSQAIVFARTKIGVDRLARDLDRLSPGLRVRALHGDMSQGSRDGVMISFKEGRVPVLIATDIAARGLDVQNVSHVINFDLPNSAEIYTHRIGRTGRAGRGGRAITLVEPKDREDMSAIEKHINVKIPEWKAADAGKPLGGSGAGKPSGRAGEREDAKAEGGSGGVGSGGVGSGEGGSGVGDGAQAEAGERKSRERPERERASRERPERGERTPRRRRERPGTTPAEAAEVAEAEAEAVDADDGAEAVVVEAAVEAGVAEGVEAGVEAGVEIGSEAEAAEDAETDVEAAEAAEAPADGDDSSDGSDEKPVVQTDEDAELTAKPDDASDDASEDAPSEASGEGSGDETGEGAVAADQPSEDHEEEQAESGESGEPVEQAESANEGENEETEAVEPAEPRHPRHLKPDQKDINDESEFGLLIVNAGAASGVEPADVIELITSRGGLSGSEVRRVRVLARFTLARVPLAKAHTVAGALAGAQLRGEGIAAEAVNGDR